ncbi:TIR domain-containing protein, partial [Bacillus sp. JJ1532]|uniref:toll/interleukin-1 receptor domain-containing protein n=1 Tax=Bacillus sp. JJ1532 TaxID=3122958 RepID=UPI003000B37F
MRAFLSHSSKDKEHYVSKIANKLGKDRVVYDALTFEEGLKSIEEIDRGLDVSDIFVVFLSENSIKSDWVQYELFRANELLNDDSKLKRIYPIIIDSRIKHDDSRIPKWLQENNLKVVLSSNKAANLILQRLRELSYVEHPTLEEKDNIFVGRNEIMDKFELRINDFEKNIPFAIFASGFSKIGRKKVIFHSLIKSDAIRSSYRPPIIKLDSHESIEDFILKLDDLGLTDSIDRVGLLRKTVEEKVQITTSLLIQLKEENQRLFIEDNGCIINHTRDIVDWFKLIYDKLKDLNYIVLGIASRYRVFEHYLFRFDNILFSHIPELNKKERAILMYRYLQFENVNLSTDDIRYFADLLSGFPEQAYYAVKLIKELGVPVSKRNTNLIIEFNTERVIKLINEYDGNQKAKDILALLTEYGTIGYNTFFDIVGNDDENNGILQEFFAKGICETFGINKEYIRLNDIIYDYLIRMGLKIPEEYRLKIVESLESFI